MNGFRSSIRWCAPVFVLILLLLTTEVARGASFTSPSWYIVSSPNQGAYDNNLTSVSASSPTDVWAVGYYYNSSLGQAGYSLFEHFNGTAWSIISGPNVGKGSGPEAVVAISSDDAWAVGAYANGTTLIEHWNGTAWSVVSSPSPTGINYLNSVSADSANDIWAAGVSYPQRNGPSQTLIEHWNGTSWSIVPSPRINAYIYLNSVAAVSPGDVWVVGKTQGKIIDRFIEHWDGTSWSIVHSPQPSPWGSDLYAVTAVSANDVWAVGNFVNYTNDKNINQTLVEHWDGTSWSIIPSPNIGTSNQGLSAVSAVSANDIWAVGEYFIPSTLTYFTETQHWNGTSWSIVPSPNVPNTDLDELNGVAAINAQDVWTVGFYEKTGGISDKTLTENYCC